MRPSVGPGCWAHTGFCSPVTQQWGLDGNLLTPGVSREAEGLWNKTLVKEKGKWAKWDLLILWLADETCCRARCCANLVDYAHIILLICIILIMIMVFQSIHKPWGIFFWELWITALRVSRPPKLIPTKSHVRFLLNYNWVLKAAGDFFFSPLRLFNFIFHEKWNNALH